MNTTKKAHSLTYSLVIAAFVWIIQSLEGANLRAETGSQTDASSKPLLLTDLFTSRSGIGKIEMYGFPLRTGGRTLVVMLAAFRTKSGDLIVALGVPRVRESGKEADEIRMILLAGRTWTASETEDAKADLPKLLGAIQKSDLLTLFGVSEEQIRNLYSVDIRNLSPKSTIDKDKKAETKPAVEGERDPK